VPAGTAVDELDAEAAFTAEMCLVLRKHMMTVDLHLWMYFVDAVAKLSESCCCKRSSSADGAAFSRH
jgi:hypothetical protein